MLTCHTPTSPLPPREPHACPQPAAATTVLEPSPLHSSLPLPAARRFNDKAYMQMGTKISMGRARWTADGASIFSGEPAPPCTPLHPPGVPPLHPPLHPPASPCIPPASPLHLLHPPWPVLLACCAANTACAARGRDVWMRERSAGAPAGRAARSGDARQRPRCFLPLSSLPLAFPAVADGKRLAQEPPPSATYYESLRAAKIQRCALETPTVAGYRWAGN